MPLRLHTRNSLLLAICLAMALSLSIVPSKSLFATASANSLNAAAPPAEESAARPAKQTNQTDTRQLSLGEPIERDLAGGEIHSYKIALTSGQYLHAVVDQRGIDAVVTVFGPDGKQLVEVDRPSGSRGPEGVSLVTKTEGVYGLQVRSLESTAARGRYQIKIDEIRVATARDESRMAAEHAVTEGEKLRTQGTADSLRAAVEKFQQALALWRALDEPYEQAVALYGLALSCRLTGEYQNAVESFRSALTLMRQVGHRYGEAVAQTGLAWTYLYLGENQKALQHFTEALAIRRSISDSSGEAFALYGIGWVYALLREDQKALNTFLQSLLIRQTIKDRRGEALTLSGIGSTYYRMGRNLEALDYLKRSLELSRSIGDRYGEANILSSLGWVYSSLKQHQTALDYFREALALRKVVGDRTGEATTLYGISQTDRKLGNLLDARSHMESSLKIIESLRNKGDCQQLCISFFASVQEYYLFYIDLLMQLHRLRPTEGFAKAALEASERARARSLLDILAEAHADIRQGVDIKLLERERDAQQRLNLAADRQRQILTREHSDEEAASAAREVETLTSEYQDLLAEIRRSSPQCAALTQPETLSAGQIQQLLDERTILLEYALGEERSYVWAVTPTTISSAELPGRSEIEAAALRVYKLLTERNQRHAGESVAQRRVRVARADTEYPKAAAVLSEMLLGSVASELGAKRLVIAAQGALQFTPFGALPAPKVNSQSSRRHQPAGNEVRNRDDYSPLIADHEIVNIPSASTLAVLRHDVADRKPAPKAVAVIADPVFSKGDERVRAVTGRNDLTTGPGAASLRERFSLLKTLAPGVRNGDNDSDQGLPRLFGTRWEADQITSLVPAGESMKAIDFAASRATATSGELSQYRIVHFATHALINDEDPELSGLALSLVDQHGRPQEGFLRTHDIFNLKLPVELVVLSGCRTALGKDFKGEGLLGMTRGFMYAGAPRVMVSLWSVNDKASAELMSRFYKRMFGPDHLSPSTALRAAQIEVWKDKRWLFPYYWAAFPLQGDWIYASSRP